MKTKVAFVAVLLCACTGVLFAAESKPPIAVADFTNETSAGWWRTGVGHELSGMLTNELAATEKFKMVERAKLDKVLQEQDLAASGRVAKGSAAKVGKLTGAKYLVMGNVSAYEEKTQGTGGGLSFGGISLGGRKDDAYIAIDVRVVDTTTGDVAYTRTIEARSGGYGIHGGLYRGGFGGNMGTYNNTPAGKAIRACLVEISDYLSCVMVDQDQCMQEYKAKDTQRREKTKKAIKLE